MADREKSPEELRAMIEYRRNLESRGVPPSQAFRMTQEWADRRGFGTERTQVMNDPYEPAGITFQEERYQVNPGLPPPANFQSRMSQRFNNDLPVDPMQTGAITPNFPSRPAPMANVQQQQPMVANAPIPQPRPAMMQTAAAQNIPMPTPNPARSLMNGFPATPPVPAQRPPMVANPPVPQMRPPMVANAPVPQPRPNMAANMPVPTPRPQLPAPTPAMQQMAAQAQAQQMAALQQDDLTDYGRRQARRSPQLARVLAQRQLGRGLY